MGSSQPRRFDDSGRIIHVVSIGVVVVNVRLGVVIVNVRLGVIVVNMMDIRVVMIPL